MNNQPTLLEDIKVALVTLFEADPGWETLFQHCGWNITASTLSSLNDAALEAQLLDTELTIDHEVTGFEDYFSGGSRLITPGQPYASLLYHALVSPNVTTQPDGTELQSYPELTTIESVENYVFAARKNSIDQLIDEARESLGLDESAEVAIALFAHDYRPAVATVHRRYADSCYSRTGVARVGTKEAYYEPSLRGFRVFDESNDGPNEIRVLPCRFAPYLAIKSKGDRNIFGPINSLSEDHNDSEIDFWVPLHKLFAGSECLQGMDLDVNFIKRHFNQKLEKLEGRLPDSSYTPQQLVEPPFRVENNFATWEDSYGQGVLMPEPNPIVLPAEITAGEGEYAKFNVPSTTTDDPTSGFSDVFAPTLTISAETIGARPWPEYAHVREQVVDGQRVSITNDPGVIDTTITGGYDALHFRDFAADGWVTVTVTNNDQLLQHSGADLGVEAAYSLIAAPDFFPQVRQRQVYEWWQAVPRLAEEGRLPEWWQWLVDNGHWADLWREPPSPLSDHRNPANVQLPDSLFKKTDQGITAIVSLPQQVEGWCLDDIEVAQESADFVRYTSLPDGAASIFAPGWDTSFDRTSGADGVDHLASYGLGSPFPEDAKLCAALSTYWPAAAPDIVRTFFEIQYTRSEDFAAVGSVAPLTDVESGIGSDSIAWDGVIGPEVVEESAESITVEYPDFKRADYTRNALNEQLSIALTHRVTLEEYKRRILAMLRGYRAVGVLDLDSGEIPDGLRTHKNTSHVVSFTVADNNNPELQEAQTDLNIELEAPVYRITAFNNTDTDGKNNVSEPEPTDETQQRARYQACENFVLFVGQGDRVIKRTRTGDGSVTQSDWELLDM